MKRRIALLLILALLTVFCACGGGEGEGEPTRGSEETLPTCTESESETADAEEAGRYPTAFPAGDDEIELPRVEF